ncbi:carboxymuconolactone decarboxylase family protein [Streptomyces sp. NPDC020801]|uniref:carboxymuconolactone decarboxylase family protein n=1 Tax=unclassified Streptomyces TaxID=2593676 RepID=UPI0037920AC2
MPTTSDTPVLDTLAAMTVDSIERCGLDERTLILTRIAALAAMDAPPVSYLAHVGPAMQANLTVEQVQDVLVAVAPVVGTARVMAAAGHITQALGFTIALADAEAQAMADAEAQAGSGSKG